MEDEDGWILAVYLSTERSGGAGNDCESPSLSEFNAQGCRHMCGTLYHARIACYGGSRRTKQEEIRRESSERTRSGGRIVAESSSDPLSFSARRTLTTTTTAATIIFLLSSEAHFSAITATIFTRKNVYLAYSREKAPPRFCSVCRARNSTTAFGAQSMPKPLGRRSIKRMWRRI